MAEPIKLPPSEYEKRQNMVLARKGLDPSQITPEERRTMPELEVFRGRYQLVPAAESDGELKEITELERANRRAQVEQANELVEFKAYEGTPITMAEAEAAVAPKPLPLTTGDAFSGETSKPGTVLPVEARQTLRIAPTMSAALSKQVSVPEGADPTGFTNRDGTVQSRQVDLTQKTTQEFEQFRGDRAKAAAAQAAIAADPQLQLLDEEGLAQALGQISYEAFFAGIPGQGGNFVQQPETMRGAGALDKQVTQGTAIPLLSPAAAAFRKTYREEATKEQTQFYKSQGMDDATALAQATRDVEGELGKPEFWEDPAKALEAAKAPPVFEGMLGVGVERYPSGATVESDGAYILRMISAPANAVVGGIAGAAGYLVPDFQKSRESSVFGGAGAADQTTGFTGSVKAGAAGNVAMNRGVAEEVYDLTSTYTDNTYVRGAAYGVGLLGDFAMPGIPGGGTAAKLAKAGSQAVDIGRVLPKALSASTALKGASVAADVDRLYGVKQAVTKTQDLDEIKRLASDGLGAESSVAKAVLAAPDAQSARKILDAAVEGSPITGKVADAERAIKALGDASPLANIPSVSRALVRWADDAIATSPEVVQRLVASGVDMTSAGSRAEAVAKIAPDAMRVQASADAVTDAIGEALFKRSPGEAVQLTPRTWALSAQDAQEIMGDAQKTWVAEYLSRPISRPEADQLIAWTQARIARLPDADAAPLRRVVQALDFSRDLPPQLVRVLQSEVVDAVARRQPGQRLRAISSDLVGRLAPEIGEELYKPVQIRRGFVARQLSVMAAKSTGSWASARGLASPKARAIYDGVSQQVSQLDRYVSSEVRRITQDSAARATYGITGQVDERGAMVAMAFSHPPTLKPGDIPVIVTGHDVADAVEAVAVWREAGLWSVKSYTELVASKPSAAMYPVQARASQAAKERFIQVMESLPPQRRDEALAGYLKELDTIWGQIPGIKVVRPEDAETLISGILFHTEATKIHQRALAEAAPRLPADLAPGIDTGQVVAQVVFRRLEGGLGQATSAAWGALRDDAVFDALEGLRSTDRAAYDRILLVADDLATSWIDELKLVQATEEELIARLGQMVSSPAGKDILSKEASDLIKSAVEAGNTLEAASQALKKNETLSAWFWAGVETLTSTQYAFMLTFRTRFHGPNWISAPAIMWQTMGGKGTVEALTRYDRGAMLAAYVAEPLGYSGSLSDSIKRMQTAVTDPAGRSWTWDEVATLAREGGITRSLTGTAASKQQVDTAARILKDARPLPSRVASKAVALGQSFAEASDTSFRASVLLKELEKGSDPQVALKLARESLYDYGKLTDWEKKNVQSWFAFYSFARASTASTIEGILTNPTRLKNVTVASKGMNLYGDGDEQRSWFYDKEYLRSRPLLAIYDGVDKARYAEYAPPLPPVDGVLFIMKVFKSLYDLDAKSFTVDRATPTLTVLLGLDEDGKKMVLEQGYIDPRHVAWLKAAGAWETFQALVPGIQSRPAKEGETSWNGRAYSLKDDGGSVNKEGAQTYWRMLQAITMLGATGMINDYAPLTAALQPDEFVSGIDMQTSIPELSGAVTQARLSTPQELAAAKRRTILKNTQTKAPK